MNRQDTTPSDMASMFKALGDPTRLRIFEFLRGCSIPITVDEAGDVRPLQGPTVGDVCCNVTGSDQITSRISFHLKELRQAGLIIMDRRGKNLICRINDDALESLSWYFSKGDEPNEHCK